MKSFNYALFGLYIKKLRLDKGMSQSEVGEALGVSKWRLQRIEKGNDYLNVDIFFKICEFFDINLETFTCIFFA